jgi:hypothetical protein
MTAALKSAAIAIFALTFLGARSLAQDASTADLTLPGGVASALTASGYLTQDYKADCAGLVAVVRFNRARDGAAIDQFFDAVAAHDEWMRSKGYGDVELVMLTAEPLATGADVILFGSMQIYPSQARYQEITAARSADRDAAYDAFVALYDAATDGSVGFRACLRDARVE